MQDKLETADTLVGGLILAKVDQTQIRQICYTVSVFNTTNKLITLHCYKSRIFGTFSLARSR